MKWFNPYSEEIEIGFFETDRYARGKRLYVGLMVVDNEGGYIELYADVTVNLPNCSISDENCAFIDVNDAPFIVELLNDYHLGQFTGRYGGSGFCSYPEFRFDMDMLKKYTGYESVNL